MIVFSESGLDPSLCHRVGTIDAISSLTRKITSTLFQRLPPSVYKFGERHREGQGGLTTKFHDSENTLAGARQERS